jgi:hypothetical protein
MAARDYPPTRLDAAKISATEYVKIRGQLSPHDRVAIVSYHGHAKRHCGLEPLNGKQQSVMTAIQNIQFGDWTAIGSGLLEAERLLFPETDTVARRLWRWLTGEEPAPSTGNLRRAVCLTDGNHNTGCHPNPIAQRMKQAGVLIDCIGIGGSPKQVNEDLLRQLASIDERNGEARYRFIDDAAQLFEYFRELAMGIMR